MCSTSPYRTIAADPPWYERGAGAYKRGADKHYPLIKTTAEIAHVMIQAPCWRPNPSGCHLWVWATTNHLPEAFDLIRFLGFHYLSGAVWIKPAIGLGQYLRHRHEHLLLARRGRAMVPPPATRAPSVIEAPSSAHSEKPAQAYDLIAQTSPEPRLEMFARVRRPGWDAWGNEV